MRLLALIALLAASAVHAQMYKCVDSRGVTQYSDKPCPGGKGREVDIQGQPPISGTLTPYKENLKGAERDFQQRQAKQERERLQEQRALEAQQRRCASQRDQLARAMATRRPADATAHDARIAALNADIARVCR